MNSSLTTTESPGALAERAHKRIARRLLPYLFFLYVIAYLDRVNLSYAALQMANEKWFNPEVLGFGSGIFFWGYFSLEIPGTILVERWSARKWISRIMVSWGIVAMFTAFVQTAHQFYWIRFLLGVAEAGFFPGIIVYLTHWFRYEDRAKALSMFIAAQPISNIIGSPLSGLLMRIHWLGLEGWRWLFILEGIPAILLGIITIFYLTDWPHQARWLPAEEREWISAELEREKKAKQLAEASTGSVARDRTLLRIGRVALLTLAYVFINAAVYGFTFWMPTITKKVWNASNLFVTLIGAIPYCVGLAGVLLIGWSSDRAKERRWHAALSLMLSAAAFFFAAMLQDHPPLVLIMFCLAAIGLYGYAPAFWSMPSSFLAGTAAAASIGVINSVGNLGGFFGPYTVGYVTSRTHSFVAGVLCLSASAIFAVGLILLFGDLKRGVRETGGDG